MCSSKTNHPRKYITEEQTFDFRTEPEKTSILTGVISALVKTHSLIWQLHSLIRAPVFSLIMQSDLKDFCFITACYLHIERLSVSFSFMFPVFLSEWWRTRRAGRSTWCSLPVRASVLPAVRRGGRSHWRGTDAALTTSSTAMRACSKTGNWYSLVLQLQ